MIYLDNNATTALDPRVGEAMLDCWASGPLNPSSQHAAGRAARNRLDDALSQIARLLGADIDSPAGDTLVLTSGGTEANNLAVHGIGDPHGPLVISAIEHPSVMEPARALAARGRSLRLIPVDSHGVINLPAAEQLILHTDPRPALVSVMAANNETGVIQPLGSIAEICRAASVPLHVDAVQIIGKLPFCFASYGAAAVSVAAHKFHGPAGAGALVVGAGVELRPQLTGGDQQLALRAGTEPVALAVGMAEALALATQSLDETMQRVSRYRDRLESHLRQQIPGISIHGAAACRLPGVTNVSFPQVERQMMLLALDSAGLACSSGSACASGSSQRSGVLQAMGLDAELVDTALRFGFSRFSTDSDAERAAEVICKQYNRLRSAAAVKNAW
jgi:cysteine desulfurase